MDNVEKESGANLFDSDVASFEPVDVLSELDLIKGWPPFGLVKHEESLLLKFCPGEEMLLMDLGDKVWGEKGELVGWMVKLVGDLVLLALGEWVMVGVLVDLVDIACKWVLVEMDLVVEFLTFIRFFSILVFSFLIFSFSFFIVAISLLHFFKLSSKFSAFVVNLKVSFSLVCAFLFK